MIETLRNGVEDALIGKNEFERVKIDLEILHDHGWVGNSRISIDLQLNELFGFLAVLPVVRFVAFASVVVGFGALIASTTVLARRSQTRLRKYFASLADVIVRTDAVGPFLSIDQASIAGLAERIRRTVTTVALWIDA